MGQGGRARGDAGRGGRSEVAALKTYGLEKGHQDTRDVGAERQIKKKVQMRGNGEGAKGMCWAPAPRVGGYRGGLYGLLRGNLGI